MCNESKSNIMDILSNILPNQRPHFRNSCGATYKASPPSQRLSLHPASTGVVPRPPFAFWGGGDG